MCAVHGNVKSNFQTIAIIVHTIQSQDKMKNFSTHPKVECFCINGVDYALRCIVGNRSGSQAEARTRLVIEHKFSAAFISHFEIMSITKMSTIVLRILVSIFATYSLRHINKPQMTLIVWRAIFRLEIFENTYVSSPIILPTSILFLCNAGVSWAVQSHFFTKYTKFNIKIQIHDL